jgi:hypothetical protein
MKVFIVFFNFICSLQNYFLLSHKNYHQRESISRRIDNLRSPDFTFIEILELKNKLTIS